jgi:POT family
LFIVCITPSIVHCELGFGQLLAVAALIIMGILEIFRKADLASHGGFNQNVAGTVYNASHISIFWQTPQFVLSGLAEAFTSVSGGFYEALLSLE